MLVDELNLPIYSARAKKWARSTSNLNYVLLYWPNQGNARNLVLEKLFLVVSSLPI